MWTLIWQLSQLLFLGMIVYIGILAVSYTHLKCHIFFTEVLHSSRKAKDKFANFRPPLREMKRRNPDGK